MRTSLWAAAGGRSAPRLRGSLRTDVCIVGAGMAGLSTAWRLAAAGYAVVVLDGREPGMGETSRTTAHLVTALDRGWSSLTAMHGDALAGLAADSHRAAIDEIEAVCQSEEIECHFERLDGFLFAAPRTPHSTLETELDAARRAGLADVEMVLRAPIRGYDTGPCLRFPRQAVCHPLRLLAGLRNAIARREGRVFGRARVEAIDGTRPLQVRVAGGATVTADAVVVATNSPIAGAPALHALQAPYRTYVIAARVPRGSITNALYWDTEEPFHYVRLERDTDQHDLLIVGGEDHKTGQGGGTANECYRRLLRWARVRFPTMGLLAFHWSGQVMESADGLGFIGRGQEADLFVVTGDSGNGMTNGMVAALLLTELIAGRQSPWQAVYDPHRLRARAVGRVARENLNVAVQLADWIRPAELDDVATVAPGSGAVLRRGLRRVAVYRRPSGEVRELSATCPHLGCIVRWNAAERTWDCPCHGSRFHPEGGVISGPTTHGLAPLSVEPVALPERKRERR